MRVMIDKPYLFAITRAKRPWNASPVTFRTVPIRSEVGSNDGEVAKDRTPTNLWCFNSNSADEQRDMVTMNRCRQ